MKALLHFSLVLLTSVSSLSAQKSNNLVVFSQDGYRFYLVLNGVKQNATPETNVKVIGLIQPGYKVSILFEQKDLADINQNVHLMWEGEQKSGWEFNYAIVKTKKGIKLRGQSAAPFTSEGPGAGQAVYTYTTGNPLPYNTGGSVNINTGTNSTSDSHTNPNPNTNTTNTTTENGNVNVGVNTTSNGINMNTTTTTTTNGGGTTDNVNVNMNVSGVDMNINMNTNTTGTTTTTTTNSSSNTSTNTVTNTTNTTNSSNGNQYQMPGYTGPVGCPWPMNSQDFEDAKKSISSKSFDDSRLTIAKQIIGSNCLLSSQVKEIMLLMSFEDTRLDLAKFAYGKTYDQGNYYKLNDAFTFESSIDELNKHIHGGK